MSHPTPYRVRVRMYRQGLGDCFLVSFRGDDGPVHALIDCGSLGATMTGVKMKDVVADIRRETGDHLHLLVATHEHKDHVSGFGTEREQFDAFRVDRVWAAWTEDPKDPLARKIARHKGDLVTAVGLAAQALAEAEADDPLREMRVGMRELLGFVGDVPEGDEPFAAAGLAKTVQEAMRYVTLRAGKDGVEFLEPGQVLEPGWLPGVRVYVLGPPRSEAALRNLGEHHSPELYHASTQLGAELAAAITFRAAGTSYAEYRATLEGGDRQEFERRLPFDPRFRVETAEEKSCRKRFAAYYDKANAWRRIDSDWLSGASDLALQLDSYTNNTSLAFAVELVDDGRVLLFAADAQLGNWLSWHDLTFRVKERGAEREVKAADLLRRAVFYKVGHHASHNATVNELGLEMMERDDLVAMIALDHQVAAKKEWTMPAPGLYRRLLEKTRGRVLRSDIGWADDAAAERVIPAAERKAGRAGVDVDIQPLYVELLLS
jgi:glyoxylase-like metal-dependent hydrolase (beta-lactamase superfamily II)